MVRSATTKGPAAVQEKMLGKAYIYNLNMQNEFLVIILAFDKNLFTRGEKSEL